jgi:hypothetical protein
MTPFQAAFLVLLILAELKNQKVRLYFGFLDSKRGRGLFMILLVFTFFDNSAKNHFLQIILGVILLVIGLINIIIQC